jgi:hypothetical protein
MPITIDSGNVLATQFSTAVSSKTQAFTIANGSNAVAIFSIGYGSTIPSMSSVTFNGVAATKINTLNLQTTFIEIWALVAPTVNATNNIIATATSGSGAITIGALTIFGAKQSGLPDSSHVDVSQTGSVTSYSQSTTVVAANSFLLVAGRANGGSALTGGTNTTTTAPEVGVFGDFFCYSTATVATGSQTLTVTSTAQQFFGVMASFAPLTSTTFIKTGSVTISNAASRTANVLRFVSYKRAISAVVSNSASRLATALKLVTFKRLVSVSVSNSVIRLATITKSRIFFRSTSVIVSNAASRLATVIAKIKGTTFWTKDTVITTTWTKDSAPTPTNWIKDS